ncbi:hypothetical protein Avbf_16232 [Armadillidium vulgare]|nr:hypothetical protein Avbf_16232 [Armadillidium vulgare]
MGKGKDKNLGSPKRNSDSPKSPKSRNNDFGFQREQLRRPDPLPQINVTPYPLSTSTEMAMAMSSEAQALQNKLKVLYEKGKSEAEEEINLVKKSLDTVYQIRNIRHELRVQAKNSGNKETIRRGALMKMLQNSAQTLPLWIGGPGEKPPPLCGAVPPEINYIGKIGDMVACLVRAVEGEENWILAEIVNFNATTNKYEVDDIDEEQKERHTLIMALYPQTTCFYKGVINQLPTLATEEYEVLFEDPSYADGYSPPLMVAQRYVIQIKESIKKK